MSRAWSCFVLEKCLCECGLTSTTMHFVSVGRQSCMQVVSASWRDTETWKPSLGTYTLHLVNIWQIFWNPGTCLAFASTKGDIWICNSCFLVCGMPCWSRCLPLSTYHLILISSMQPILVEINNEYDGCRSWLKEREEKKKLIVIPQSDCQGC